ncbi:MAG: Ig-like domain-containing protein [Acidobacteriota bacterium]|nr:Ig-like domain-containing protein [Acidobacteriota bacterium]
MRRPVLALVIAGSLLTAHPDAQPATRRATTIAALRSYPGFYHQQTVSVVGAVKGEDVENLLLANDEATIRVIARELPREGRLEARGQFLDIGRVSQDDPRLIPFNLGDRIRALYPERWPRPGEELLLLLSGTLPPPPPADATTPPLRSVALEPARFEGQRVAIVGQFRGRNLYGDLPEAPAPARWQFVLRSTDTALWVMDLQPRGKAFNFDPTKRVDAGRWVRVQGTVRTAKGLTWLEGTTIELAQAPAEPATEVAIAAPPPAPVEVLFTAPVEGETDVSVGERVRLQLSRDLDAASLTDRVRITYAKDSTGRAIGFATNYTRENRAIEIRPNEPFEAFRLVRIEFLEGIRGTDGGALAPFALTFTTGGS